MDENVTPIGERLGSERLYRQEFPADDEGMFFGSKPVKAPKPVAGPPPSPEASTVGARPSRRGWMSTVLELAGITVLAVGCWLLLPAIGLIVAGLCLILYGVAVGL